MVMPRIKSPENLVGALILVAIGILGILLSADLRTGTASRMGPGYFPTLLSWCIFILGLFVGLRSVTVEGASLGAFKARPILFVIGATLAFGFLIDHFGLIPSALAVVFIASYAEVGRKFSEAVILSLVLSMLVVGIFVYLLGQPITLWGQ